MASLSIRYIQNCGIRTESWALRGDLILIGVSYTGTPRICLSNLQRRRQRSFSIATQIPFDFSELKINNWHNSPNLPFFLFLKVG